MASIDIAVCAAGGGERLAACLDALAAQPPPVLIWLVLVGDAQADAAVAPETEVRVLHARGPGLAAARNAALAACTADVLAFVEEDVVVQPGWLGALRAAWNAAPPHVAAIGGPIDLQLGAAAPSWFSDALHAGYATLDYGSEPLALDPATRTLHGGNLSVRCAALRALGGFWPARGHRDGRDWYSEEHHAQRELAGAGWETRYEPAARVARVPPPALLRPAAVLRRRWRYGARMAIADRTQPVAATLSQAATAAAGAALAAAQRKPAVALERAARAAQNVGSLTGRPLAARDFRVTGARPFGSEIPRAPAARRLRAPTRSGSAAVLLYHRVADPASSPDGMCVDPGRFAEQLEQIAAHRVLELAELAELARAKRVPAGALAVSFDDGYADTLVNARPRLAAAGVPATVFVSTGHIADQRPFFWDTLYRLLGDGERRPQQLTLSFSDGSRAWRTDTPERRDRARRQIHHLIQPAAPEVIERVLAELAAWADGAAHGVPRAMTIDELRELAADPLIAIGAHTVRHVNLGFQGELMQREEIERSRDDVSAWLGAAPAGFSYPFGIPEVDFHAETRRLVAGAGFSYAVANADGAVSARSDPYALPRYFVPDLGGEEFADWLRVRLRPA